MTEKKEPAVTDEKSETVTAPKKPTKKQVTEWKQNRSRLLEEQQTRTALNASYRVQQGGNT